MGYLDKDRLPNQYFFYFIDKYEVADAYGKDQVITHNNKVEYTGKGKMWESKVTSYFLNIKKPIDLTPKNPLFISYENYVKQVKKNIRDKNWFKKYYEYQTGYRYGLELSKKELNKILEKTLGKDYLLNKDYTDRYDESFIESFKKDEKMTHTYSHFIEHKNRNYNSKFLYRFYIKMIEKKIDGLVFLEDTNWDGHFYGEMHKKYESGELKFDYHRWVEKPKVFACLESNQIKLADGTNTTFDGINPDIRFDDGGIVKIKSFKTSEGDFDIYDLDENHRGRADMFVVLKDKKGWVIRNVIIPKELQRKGIATKFYISMNKMSLNKTGKPLHSTQERKLSNGQIVHELSEDGIAFWDSLVSKGYANKISEKNYIFINDKEKFNDGGEVKTGLFAQIWEWFGIKF
jgi:hypothetical protein